MMMNNTTFRTKGHAMKNTALKTRNRISILLLLCLSLVSFHVRAADFESAPEALNELFSKKGSFYSETDASITKAHACSTVLVNSNKTIQFFAFRPSTYEFVLGVGLKMPRYTVAQQIEEGSAASVKTEFKVLSESPLVFETKKNTGSNTFLIERYQYDPQNSSIAVTSVDCQNCQGGQKIAFDGLKSGPPIINRYCEGPVL
mgnify:CR=1 FL=1